MRFRLLRLDVDVEIQEGDISTLEIEDRTLFARVVKALLSEVGEYAEEPYLLFDDSGKRVNPKKALHVINTLPEVPLSDRTMLAKLFKLVTERSELEPALYEQIQSLSSALMEATEDIVGGMRGDYGLAVEWSYETFLKSFGLSPITNQDYSLLDNCIRLFGFCADIGDLAPVVLVNAKSFFSENELEELFDQAVFSGTRLLLLESWIDARTFTRETKTTIDQHLCAE